MKIHILKFLNILFLLPLVTWALDCPTPPPEYQHTLNHLLSFEQELLEPGKCRDLAQSLSNLKGLYQRSHADEAIEFIRQKKQGQLTPGEAAELSHFSGELASSVVGLVTLLNNNKDCVPDEKKVSWALVVAGLTQEITGFAAQYSGPYGVPVALAGGAIAAALKGIDQYVLQNDSGYDFNNREHRLLFVRGQCIYHNIRRDLEDYLEPSQRVHIYQELQKALVEKKKRIEGQAKDQVDTYNRWSHTYLELSKIITKTLSETNKLKTSFDEKSKQTTPQEICRGLSNMIYPGKFSGHPSRLQILKLAMELDFKHEKGMEEKLADLTSLYNIMLSGERALYTDRKCLLEQDDEVLAKEISRLVSFIHVFSEEVLSTYKYFIEQLIAAAELRPDANGVKINYMLWYEGTLEKARWTDAQLEKLDHLSQGSSEAERSEILGLRDYLDHRLFISLAPNFLEWHLEENADDHQDDFSDIWDEFSSDVTKEFEKLNYQYPDEENPLYYLLRLKERVVNRPIDFSHLYRELAELYTHYLGVSLSVSVVNRWCDFWSRDGIKTNEIKSYCESDDLNSLRKFLSDNKYIHDGAIKYFEWAHDNKKVEADSVRERLKSIQECYQRLPECRVP